jgi:hypothetical protein
MLDIATKLQKAGFNSISEVYTSQATLFEAKLGGENHTDFRLKLAIRFTPGTAPYPQWHSVER